MCHPQTPIPSDLSPLSYGTGLALGLMLILGLPRAPAHSRSAAVDPGRATPPSSYAAAANRYRADVSLVVRAARRERPSTAVMRSAP